MTYFFTYFFKSGALSATLLAINIILAITIIFLERKKPSAAWAWIFVLFFLPYVGFILYLLIGKPLRQKHMQRWIPKKSIGIQEMIDDQKRRVLQDGLNIENVDNARELIHMNLQTNDAVVTKNNHVELFDDGRDKFDSLLRDISRANDHIHVQYYIFKLDGIGQQIVDALTERAKAGVEVRILYDALGSRNVRKRHFKKLLDAGGEVEVFFPSILPLINPRMNYRNHRKIVVIDGQIGYLGGFNVGDEYLGLDKKFGYWRDTHMRIQGAAVHALQARFMMDWNQAGNSLNLAFATHYFPAHDITGDVAMQIVSSGPDTHHANIENSYIKMILQAKRYVYIQSPYFIPDDAFLEAVRIAVLSGIDVRIMIPDKPDHPFVYMATCSYAGDLMESGAKVYHYGNGFIHSKVVLIDDQIASVGTANVDNRSFRLNFEVNGFIYNEKITKELADMFHKDLEVCIEMTKESYEARSLWIKFKESVSRMLSPIL
ncbi:cardiolipin synthase [Kurthia huakuii]|uniref:cardiolipin synthase n=1 Tax=Kurthia huakuii TaxID=1421019 RepID=UPI00049756F0|nr:cardiolipin synthase [Kurthia huakuii]MBM7699483.1 cardiolipin synthase [Kurthia huakuii]